MGGTVPPRSPLSCGTQLENPAEQSTILLSPLPLSEFLLSGVFAKKYRFKGSSA